MYNYPNLSNPFPSYYEEFIHQSRYARWREEDNRRETWAETVKRLMDYYCHKAALDEDTAIELYTAIHQLETLPSMRALMTAGQALDRDHIAAYNCAYLPVDDPKAFDEACYILMCGTGVGYSVEREYVDKLPEIPEELHPAGVVITVGDSKAGWAKSYRQLISLLYSGSIPEWDVSKVRPRGARLKTFGGRASGPEPLVDLFRFTIDIFKRAVGRKLSTLEAHDLMCKVADIVVVGGVRRSAMISLSDLADDRMRGAKMGEWWARNGHRRLANNSAVYERRRPDMGMFMKEWVSLEESKSGERGIFSRYATQRLAGRSGRRDVNHAFGTNPCSEIILRPFQFCNLSSVVVRSTDSLEDIKRKARIAAILGTIQSSFTEFKYLRPIWRRNCEEERLLGVSLTGICDNRALLKNPVALAEVRDYVVEVNKEWAARLDIPQSTATTCVKPEGTSSQMTDTASGMHRRFAPYYIRRVRGDVKDPLTQFLMTAGVPYEVDLMNASNIVFSFPKKAPVGASVRNNATALDDLELWKQLQLEWCEHKPSVTISVKDEEWMDVGAWVYRNFDILSGVSFLPYDGGSYPQMPYEEITEEQYEELMQKMPATINWDELREYETEDTTTGSQEYACAGGVCEIVDIGSTMDG